MMDDIAGNSILVENGLVPSNIHNGQVVQLENTGMTNASSQIDANLVIPMNRQIGSTLNNTLANSFNQELIKTETPPQVANALESLGSESELTKVTSFQVNGSLLNSQNSNLQSLSPSINTFVNAVTSTVDDVSSQNISIINHDDNRKSTNIMKTDVTGNFIADNTSTMSQLISVQNTSSLSGGINVLSASSLAKMVQSSSCLAPPTTSCLAQPSTSCLAPPTTSCSQALLNSRVGIVCPLQGADNRNAMIKVETGLDATTSDALQTGQINKPLDKLGICMSNSPVKITNLTNLPNPGSDLNAANVTKLAGAITLSQGEHTLLLCTMCEKKFATAELLKRHMKSHSGVSCHLCTMVFKDRLTLAKHQVEMHTSERTYPCSQCDKTFKETRTLRLHLKIHNSEYPEQCGVCNKVFRTKWQLKQHLMDHGGERPYPCPECTFTCKTKQQLNEHRRKHSGEKAYSCPQCGTRFTYRNGLIKHTKLNRCPKKIVTPEGETIIKKRSRIIAKFPATSSQGDSETSCTSTSTASTVSSPSTSSSSSTSPVKTEKSQVDQKILHTLQRRCMSTGQSVNQSKNLPLVTSMGNLSESSSMLDTSADISSWARLLPAGTKVTVTHYDASKKSGESGELVATPTHTQTILVTENMEKMVNQPSLQQRRLMLSRNGVPLRHLTPAALPAANLTTSNLSAHATTDNMISTQSLTLPSAALSAPVLTTPTQVSPSGSLPQTSITRIPKMAMVPPMFPKMASLSSIPSMSSSLAPNLIPPTSYSQEALNLFSSIGLSGYSEYFAVDPNEILSEERKGSSSTAGTPAISIQPESCQPEANPQVKIEPQSTQIKVKSEPESTSLDFLKEWFDCQPDLLTQQQEPDRKADQNIINSDQENNSAAKVKVEVDSAEMEVETALETQVATPLATVETNLNDAHFNLLHSSCTGSSPVVKTESSCFENVTGSLQTPGLPNSLASDVMSTSFSSDAMSAPDGDLVESLIKVESGGGPAYGQCFLPPSAEDSIILEPSLDSAPTQVKIPTEILTEQMTPLASPDSGYGESCNFGLASGESSFGLTSVDSCNFGLSSVDLFQSAVGLTSDTKDEKCTWLTGVKCEDSEMYDCFNQQSVQQTSTPVHKTTGKKSWLSDLEVDFNALIKEIDENSSSVNITSRSSENSSKENIFFSV